jgi:hypothetical protein
MLRLGRLCCLVMVGLSKTKDTNHDGVLIPSEEGEDCDFNDVIRVVSNVLQFILFVLLPAIVLFYIAKAAFYFITQGDNPASITLAKSTLKWTFIGALVMLLSWYFVSLLFSLLGVQNYSWLASRSEMQNSDQSVDSSTRII